MTAPDPVRAGRALGGAAAAILLLEGIAVLFVPRGIAQSGDGRVVTVSSLMHTFAGKAPLGDPREQAGNYNAWRVYGQSKLANLYLTSELDRRLRQQGPAALAAFGRVAQPPGRDPVFGGAVRAADVHVFRIHLCLHVVLRPSLMSVRRLRRRRRRT